MYKQRFVVVKYQKRESGPLVVTATSAVILFLQIWPCSLSASAGVDWLWPQWSNEPPEIKVRTCCPRTVWPVHFNLSAWRFAALVGVFCICVSVCVSVSLCLLHTRGQVCVYNFSAGDGESTPTERQREMHHFKVNVFRVGRQRKGRFFRALRE